MIDGVMAQMRCCIDKDKGLSVCSIYELIEYLEIEYPLHYYQQTNSFSTNLLPLFHYTKLCTEQQKIHTST